MRITCPHCRREVTVDDRLAESIVYCPECSQPFTAPALLSGSANQPRPTAPVAPPAAGPATAAAVESSEPPPKSATPPAGSQALPAQSWRLPIRRRCVVWIGPIALLTILVLSFFDWVGAYPNGKAVYTQSSWQIMRGSFSVDAAGEEAFTRENDLRPASHFSFTMLLTLLLLVAAAIIAGLDLAEEHVVFAVPDVIQKIWPHRLAVLSAASLLIWGLLTLQCLTGLGLETAAPIMAESVVKAAEPRRDPDAPPESTKTRTAREFKIAREVAQLGLARTWAWRLGYAASIIAVIGYGLELMLARRGRRPEPVIELHY